MNGDPMAAWRLTEAGFDLALQHLGAANGLKFSPKDIGADFLAHQIALNDLYVHLLLALPLAPGRGAPAARQPFRWCSSDSVRLPWTHYEPDGSGVKQKRIEPDAVLESAPHRRRWFLECEMGGHSLSNPDPKSGSTMSKIRRYAAFYAGYSDASAKVTHYRASYPDAWPAELVFLVPGEIRRGHIDAVIATWRKEAGQAGQVDAFAAKNDLQVRALAFDQAPAHFHAQLSGAKTAAHAPTSSAPLPSADALRLMRFTATLIDNYKVVRHQARAENRSVPPYPTEDRDFVLELLERHGIRRRK
jgi:hypothetical protein